LGVLGVLGSSCWSRGRRAMLTIQNPDGASLAAPGPLANRLDPTPKAEQRGAAPQTPATAVTKLRRTLRSPAAAGCMNHESCHRNLDRQEPGHLLSQLTRLTSCTPYILLHLFYHLHLSQPPQLLLIRCRLRQPGCVGGKRYGAGQVRAPSLKHRALRPQDFQIHPCFSIKLRAPCRAKEDPPNIRWMRC
jgi:hypothetical protein